MPSVPTEDSADKAADDLAALAERTGLTALRALDPAAFADAVRVARAMGDGTPRPETPATEPAHVARFPLAATAPEADAGDASGTEA